MSSGLTPRGDAFLAASQLREATEDLSAQEINKLSMSDYARIREAAGLSSVDPYSEAYAPEPPGRPRQAQGHPDQDPQPEPIDVQAMGMTEYAAIRNRYIRPSSGTGRGLFD
jgi:hypothetical protein